MRRVLLEAAALSVAALLAGCAREVVREPEPVTVTVERYRDLPDWATRELVKPAPADGTVGARVKSNDARGGVIDVANCHRRLLRLLDKGEQVDAHECEGE